MFRFVHFVSSYLDIFIGEKYSFTTVLAELARCLSLFQNLHTVQIDGDSNSGSGSRRREIFEQTFKKYTYPQIRNVFVTDFSAIFIASCPQARRVGITTTSHIIPTFGFRSIQGLHDIQSSCPHLEVFEDFGNVFLAYNACNRA